MPLIFSSGGLFPYLKITIFDNIPSSSSRIISCVNEIDFKTFSFLTLLYYFYLGIFEFLIKSLLSKKSN
jgi:hypothetical protein